MNHRDGAGGVFRLPSSEQVTGNVNLGKYPSSCVVGKPWEIKANGCEWYTRSFRCGTCVK